MDKQCRVFKVKTSNFVFVLETGKPVEGCKDRGDIYRPLLSDTEEMQSSQNGHGDLASSLYQSCMDFVKVFDLGKRTDQTWRKICCQTIFGDSHFFP